jgi:macrolide transport system ATP-binding/permease protein
MSASVATAAPPVVDIVGVTKVYGEGESAVHALRGVDLRIERGEAVAIVGASGSGKSTLMNLVGCLDRPTTGQCKVGGRDVALLDADGRAALRNQTIGFVFQGFHLLSRTTATENVELPLVYQGGVSSAQRADRARAMLERVGLGARLDHTSNQLSGGQQQRVAIARALVTEPALLLADEPTGNLDSKTSVEVLELLLKLNAEGVTIVCVTHSPEIAAGFPRQVEVKDGQIIRDTGRVAPERPGEAASTHTPQPDYLATLPVALRAIRRNLLRSGLTALGVVVGVGAVVGMLAVGRGARSAMQQQVLTLGTNLVSVRSGSQGRGGVRMGMGSSNTLTTEDVAAVAKLCPSLALVSPQIQSNVQAIAAELNWATQIEGVGEHYLEIRNMQVASGAPLDPSDIRSGAKVCLVGPTVVASSTAVATPSARRSASTGSP